MDVSGSNRYELLFMDDESSAATAAAVDNAMQIKKQTNPSTSVKAGPPVSKKVSNSVEKENKSNALNKNNDQSGVKKVAMSLGPKTKQVNREVFNKSDNNFRRNNAADVIENSTEGREMRNNRRMAREQIGEYSNENQQRPFRQFKDRENRGPPRNRFGENGFRVGKREFDRQSGSDKTGVKAVDKRDGAGAHNWGSVKQEIEDINKSTAPDTDAILTDKEESTNEQLTTETLMPLEEDTKEMTLDEWKAMKEQRAKPQFNIRKAGEGEDNAQWKKMVILNKKKKEGANSDDEELEYDPSMYPQRVGRQQRIVDIQFNFSDNRRSGTGFGRGRGRGTRPNGGDRFQFENEDTRFNRNNVVKPQRSNKPKTGVNSLKVDDERQFPTLS